MAEGIVVRVVDSNGNPAVCYRCGNPASTFINTSANMASSVPSHMEPVCAEHDPYEMHDMMMVSRSEWERLQAQLAAQIAVISAARVFTRLVWSGAPAYKYDAAHDALDKALAALDAHRAVQA